MWESPRMSQMLEILPLKSNVVPGHTMTLGFAYQTHQAEQEALLLYSQMQQEGVVPNYRTYVGVLKACRSLAALGGRNGRHALGTSVREQCLQTVKAVHSDVVKGKCKSDVFVANMLVDAYSKCGSVEDARQVFDNMPVRSVVSWTAMILGYAHMHKGEEALKLYMLMRRAGIVPNERTYVGALKACSSMAELGADGAPPKRQCLEPLVRAIHQDVKKARLEPNVFVGNMLVDAYAKCGSLETARQVFEDMSYRNVVVWNTMIFGYSQQAGKGEEALLLYKRMQQGGVVPDARTYVGALQACGAIAEQVRNQGDGVFVTKQCLKTVTTIHRHVLKRKMEADVFVATMLVDVYSKCGSLEEARKLFENMPHRDAVSWNAMILGYAQMQEPQEALYLYELMRQESVVPDDRTYVALLKACCTLAQQAGDRKMHCLGTVASIHADVGKGGFDSNVFVANMLVNAYAKCGNLEKARLVFDKIPHRDVVSWTAMVLGYAQMDKGEEALHLYSQMQQEGVRPNELTFVAALTACSSVAGLEKGKQIHAQIREAGVDLCASSHVANSLIDMYGKCSSMAEAREVFDAMAAKDMVAWNALLLGYAKQGQSEAVFHLLERMKQEGIHPNEITFLGVLMVCSHVGLMDTGQKFLDAMSRDYGIAPSIQHLNCMVDLLGRAGRIHQAMAMVRSMPFPADMSVWRSILSACQKWRAVELGRQAFECAVRLDARDAAPYVFMANIYLAAGMPAMADRVQACRVKEQVWKEPGRSCWMDGSGKVHAFLVADAGHPESDGIYAKLDDIVASLRRNLIS